MNSKPVGRLERTLQAIGSAALLVLMLVVFADVVGRNLFNRPLPWGTELLEVVLAVMVFAFYPILALRSTHITVDLITVRPSLQKVQRVLAGVVGAVLFTVIAYCCARQAIRSASYGDASALLHIPTADVLAGMSAMAAATVLAFIVAIVMTLRGVPATPHAPME